MIYAVYNIPISFPFLSFSLFSSHGCFNSFRFFGKIASFKKAANFPRSTNPWVVTLRGLAVPAGSWWPNQKTGWFNKQNTKSIKHVFFPTESQLQQKKHQLCFWPRLSVMSPFFFLIAASQSAFCPLHLLKGSSLECASLLLLESPVGFGPPFDRRGHYRELPWWIFWGKISDDCLSQKTDPIVKINQMKPFIVLNGNKISNQDVSPTTTVA